ncbi:5-methylcytosine-specific restriction endonuclease system specificity protein McrC [Clostridium sp. B9]|uniref:5-methylcytosine-specific restriction endonuclease system specificity protein McrC n=1 Tax=Clostridium sp. B9 TaxID=3423224 RepID=UPI003D2ED3FC
MEGISKIPIKNIYYMLCYAWEMVDKSEEVSLGNEEFDNIYNLLCKMYIKELESLTKRGFNKYYLRNEEALSTLRGKINVSSSIKGQTLFSNKLICEFDEFSKDIRLNQILKTTLNLFLKAPNLDKGLREKLIKLRVYFSDINEIKLRKELFSSLRYNKHNNHYKVLINISQLLYEGLITNEENGDFTFAGFIKENQMAKLYEKFILNFYKVHLDKKVYKVHSPKIRWKLTGEVSDEALELLPEMRTDIVIENKVEKTQLIIDAKYYEEALVSSGWGSRKKIRTSHLYQILTYVNNSDFDGEVKGMLLYPTVNNDININFGINFKKIGVTTLNFTYRWEEISNSLEKIIICKYC